MAEEQVEDGSLKSAYDLKRLAEMAKAEGLELAEDGAGRALTVVLAWLKECAAKSSNQIDDMVVPMLAPLEAYVRSEIDKIDGQQG